jgi:hypothetical protein
MTLARENPKFIRTRITELQEGIPCKGESKEKTLRTSPARGTVYK